MGLLQEFIQTMEIDITETKAELGEDRLEQREDHRDRREDRKQIALGNYYINTRRNTMKTLKYGVLLVIAVVYTSCSEDDDTVVQDPTENTENLCTADNRFTELEFIIQKSNRTIF